MSKVTIKDLLEAGVHFGHQTRRWNPKMARYIFGERNGIYIINLEKTMICLDDACTFLKSIAAAGKSILFIGTKKQAQAIIEETAKRCDMPYVVNRWLGGMLTNFETVRRSISRMNEITTMEADGSFDAFTKKEISRMLKERDKMKRNLEGIQDMINLPGAVFIIDTKKEEIALREARKLRIPVVALIDTNADPDEVDYPIPGNDDALRSIGIVCQGIGGFVLDGVRQWEKISAAAKKKAAEEKAEGEKPKPKAKVKEKVHGKEKAVSKTKVRTRGKEKQKEKEAITEAPASATE